MLVQLADLVHVLLLADLEVVLGGTNVFLACDAAFVLVDYEGLSAVVVVAAHRVSLVVAQIAVAGPGLEVG